MNNLKATVIGSDRDIQNHQIRLYDRLYDKWQLTTDNFMGYGRVYRNKRNGAFIPEWHELATAKDYKEVAWNDRMSAMFFYGVADTVQHDGVNTKTDAHLVFFVNLEALSKDLPSRGDYEVRNDVYNVIAVNQFGLKLKSETVGVDQVLKEYDGLVTDENFAKFDMHPRHCFRFDFELVFKPNI